MNTVTATGSLPEVTLDFQDEKRSRKKWPEENVHILSKIWFCWMNGLIHTGYKRDLTRDDLWEMSLKETTDYNTERLEFEWNPKAQEYMKYKQELSKAEQTEVGELKKGNGVQHTKK